MPYQAIQALLAESDLGLLLIALAGGMFWYLLYRKHRTKERAKMVAVEKLFK